MGAVLRLVRKDNADTVRVLESLLNEARRGEVEAVCATYRRRSGREDLAFSGRYLHDPSKALLAAVRMKRALIDADEQ